MSTVVRNTWSKQTYDWVMSLRPAHWPERARGEMSTRAAERETGVPRDTINGWWRGTRPNVLGREAGRTHEPMQRCRRGHALTAVNTRLNRTRARTLRQCVRCKRESDKAYGYRRRNTYHPVHNPNLALAPMHCLWVPAADVVKLILRGYTVKGINEMWGARTSLGRSWRYLRDDKKWWLRLDAADRMLTELGLNLLELDREPTYSTKIPEGRPC